MFVIVYGALRSGTTLLRLMLDMNPGLSCPGETDFIFDYVKTGPDGALWIDAEAMGEDRVFRASGVRFNASLPPREAILDMIAQLHRQSDDCVVLMLHRGVETALTLFPDTPVLHMLRDPRDVARSSIGMGWAGTVYHGVEHWIDTEAEWDRAVAAHPDMVTQDLRYETLILEPEAELKSLSAFFGVSYVPQMLDYADNSTYSAPDIKLIEQWKRKQSAQEIGLVEARLGDVLTDRGYAPSGHAPLVPDGAQMRQLWWQNKRMIWRTRFERYGYRDPILAFAARKLGRPGMAHGAKTRMDAKLDTLVK